MKIFIAHSIGCEDLVKKYAIDLKMQGHSIFVPGSDNPYNIGFRMERHPEISEEDLLRYNLDALKMADEVHVFWDGSSLGTIFDLGCAYALRIPIKVIWIKERHWHNYIRNNTGKYILGDRK